MTSCLQHFGIAIVLSGGLCLTGCSPTPGKPAKQTTANEKAVRITQFYASERRLPRGEKTLLCYGVENATSIRLSPPVEEVWPSFSTCFEISPTQSTTYTLAAGDARGRTVYQSVTVEVGPPLPKILEVSVNSMNIKRGEPVILCYKSRNAQSVQAGPGNFQGPHSPLKGCLIDQPAKTTTYTVTIAGAEGKTDTERVTVKVR